MALISCPECQYQVSTEAIACPKCAFPYPGRKGQSEELQSLSLVSCTDCGSRISRNATMCPHCGAPPNNSVEKGMTEPAVLAQVGQNSVRNAVESSPDRSEVLGDLPEPLQETVEIPRGISEQLFDAPGYSEEKAGLETRESEGQKQSWICSHCGLPLPKRGKEHHSHGNGVDHSTQPHMSNGLGNGESSPTHVATVSTQEALDPQLEEVTEKIEELPLPPKRPGWEESDTQIPKQRSTLEDQAEIVKFLYGDGETSLMRERRSLERQATNRRRKLSPLWEEIKLSHEEASSHPTRRKKWPVVLLLFVIVLVAGGWAAIWQMGNLNGLEALVYWHL